MVEYKADRKTRPVERSAVQSYVRWLDCYNNIL